MKSDVLIVGAGPVGLINGLLLARQGVEVTVVDEQPGIVDSRSACGRRGACHQSYKRLRAHGRCV